MAEVITSSETFDESALTVLLTELSSDLPGDIVGLLDDPYLNHEILKYLDRITSIESKDYISSAPPIPASNDASAEERTLMQDIAELEASQRALDTTLKSLVVKSQKSIISNKISLDQSAKLFDQDFNSYVKLIWRNLNQDNLNDYGEGDDEDQLDVDLAEEASKNTFRSTVSKIRSDDAKNKEHNKNLSTVLENIDQISITLELPSLTGACIKAGYYSEALEISSYTRRLAIRFPTNDLIKEVEVGIRNEMAYMLSGLIRLLRTNLKQSALIKTLSYLKRIPPFSQSKDSEGQLKRILLHARYLFIKSELSSLVPLRESELWENYLKRSIEVIREHCFASIMTYSSVFPDIDDNELGDVVISIERPDTTITKTAPDVVEENKTEESENEIDETKIEDFDKDKRDLTKHETTKSDNKNDDGFVELEPPEKPENLQEEKDLHKNSGLQKIEKAAHYSNDEAERNGPTELEDIESKLFGNRASTRNQSNTLLVEYVENVTKELIPVLENSLINIRQQSIRDGLYLQLIYCAKSLSRIDENYGDLVTSLLLNSKFKREGAENFVIDRVGWLSALDKQRKLTLSLNRAD